MRSGKLNEELSRMSEILDHIRPGAMILLNESFAATNEREGPEIRTSDCWRFVGWTYQDRVCVSFARLCSEHVREEAQ